MQQLGKARQTAVGGVQAPLSILRVSIRERIGHIQPGRARIMRNSEVNHRVNRHQVHRASAGRLMSAASEATRYSHGIGRNTQTESVR
jgi:hypothetical protein